MGLVHLHRRFGHPLLAAWLLLAWTVAIAAACPAYSRPLAPHEIKAVWLLNFARYIDWPADAFPRSNAPIVVAVVGRDPFGAALESAFAGKTARGRTLLVRRLSVEQSLAGCHIVYFSPAEKKRYRELAEKVRGRPILTVGDSSEFLESGGMVQFERQDDTIRFSVNLEPARHSRLRASAQLLKVAASVRGTYE